MSAAAIEDMCLVLLNVYCHNCHSRGTVLNIVIKLIFPSMRPGRPVTDILQNKFFTSL